MPTILPGALIAFEVSAIITSMVVSSASMIDILPVKVNSVNAVAYNGIDSIALERYLQTVEYREAHSQIRSHAYRGEGYCLNVRIYLFYMVNYSRYFDIILM